MKVCGNGNIFMYEGIRLDPVSAEPSAVKLETTVIPGLVIYELVERTCVVRVSVWLGGGRR